MKRRQTAGGWFAQIQTEINGVLVGIGWNRKYSQQQMGRDRALVVETINQIWSWVGMPFGALGKTNKANFPWGTTSNMRSCSSTHFLLGEFTEGRHDVDIYIYIYLYIYVTYLFNTFIYWYMLFSVFPVVEDYIYIYTINHAFVPIGCSRDS
jgi:hypothetical protein